MNKNMILLHAMKSYDNPHCVSVDEFKDDLKTLSRVNRFLRKVNDDPVLLRKSVNQVVVAYNLFSDRATELLLASTDRSNWPLLATIIKYLNRLHPGYTFEGVQVSGLVDNTFLKRLENLS
jgi:hypothetical protein